MRAGRPRESQSAGERAPQLTIRLDARAEAAVVALRVLWQTDADGVPAAAAALKRAAVATAERECPDELARALALIAQRRRDEAA